MVFYILAAGILLSGIYAFRLPTMYTSSTTLMPPDNASSGGAGLLGLLSMSGSSSAASVGGSLLGVKTPGALFLGILSSRTVLESMVKRFDLVHYYKTRQMEDAIGRLAQDTHVFEDPKNGIIRISVDANDPVLASKMAQAYVEELNRVVAMESTSAAGRERVFLEGRLEEIKQDLDKSSELLSQFSSKNRTIDIASQGRAMVDAGLRLQAELASAQSDLAGLRQIYSEDNVKIRSATARVEELQRQFGKITGSAPDIDSTGKTSQSGYPSLGALPGLGVTYADLDRKVIVEQDLWEALTKQYEAAKVQEAKDIPSVRVLDPANVPEHKSYPIRRNIVLLGSIFSLFVACILVLALSAFDNMGAQDERMKLVTEIAGTTLNSLSWFWRLPGMSRIHARLHGLEKHR